jgi:hypothetical protein
MLTNMAPYANISMSLREAVTLFYSGIKLQFGNNHHIAARNYLRTIKRGTKDHKLLCDIIDSLDEC